MSESELPVQPLPTAEAIGRNSFERLLEISTSLSSTLNLPELLALIMDVAIELTQTQRASILLVDNKTGNLQFAASTDGHVPSDIEVPLDGSIAGWVVRNGRSLILSDVQTDERFYASVDEELELVTKSMMAVPLVTKKGVIGALEVLNKRNDEPYTGQDIALMEALASQSAVAIVNASLFYQSDLLAEIMHEIKTPLMAITAAGDLLKRPELPSEKRAELLDMIQRESFRLSKMTVDFLDFARLESGRERLEREPVAIDELIGEVISIGHSQASSRKVTIVKENLRELPGDDHHWRLIGDGDRLKQVLLNLVSNAIKYNVEGGQITITLGREDHELGIKVADTGRGIAEQDIEHLFERFYRIPGSEQWSEGSGMGLAIAHKIVEEHDGRIEVSSAIGEGTTFTVYLPLTAKTDGTR
jgi:signal transduction histidine kinase